MGYFTNFYQEPPIVLSHVFTQNPWLDLKVIMGDKGGTVQNFITLSSNSDESINLIYPCVKEIWLFIKHPTGSCHHIALPELFRGHGKLETTFFLA